MLVVGAAMVSTSQAQGLVCTEAPGSPLEPFIARLKGSWAPGSLSQSQKPSLCTRRPGLKLDAPRASRAWPEHKGFLAAHCLLETKVVLEPQPRGRVILHPQPQLGG